VAEKPVVSQLDPIIVDLTKRTRMLPSTRHDYDKLTNQYAGLHEVLVPIKFEFELDGYKIRDQFLWNLNERLLSPEKFAEYICHDLQLTSQYATIISTHIKQQIKEYRIFYSVHDLPHEPDTRITIKLDIFCGKVHLRDRFEWDLAGDYSPEEFSRLLCNDLGLGGEFASLVACRYVRDAVFIEHLMQYTRADQQGKERQGH
jgi:chromatin structure-remodeling complex subunit SFH1